MSPKKEPVTTLIYGYKLWLNLLRNSLSSRPQNQLKEMLRSLNMIIDRYTDIQDIFTKSVFAINGWSDLSSKGTSFCAYILL